MSNHFPNERPNNKYIKRNNKNVNSSFKENSNNEQRPNI
jgi:hypothetical protein